MIKKYKNKIIIGAAVIAVLAFVFWYGGNAPDLRGWNAAQSESRQESQSEMPKKTAAASDNEKKEEPLQAAPSEQAADESQAAPNGQNPQSAPPENAPRESAKDNALSGSASENKENEQYSIEQGMKIDEETGKDEHMTDPVPAGNPVPVEPENAKISDKEMTCTLSVRCDTILKNIEWLNKEKLDLVPSDGVIFAERTVSFYEGESVFNLLVREMKKNKIHMEFVNTPIYNSAYIEGIANLYEFDCGELSGWMYRVNGWFPNYGCSRYQLKEGDRVEWIYTCSLGSDIGGDYSAKNGR